MDEIWKDIPNYEGRYQASSDGRIRSLDTTLHVRSKYGALVKQQRKGRILKPWINKKGYCYVSLGSGNHNRKEIHYFIGITFLGERLKGYEINHKDGNKANNRVDNIEWCTRQQNIRHAFDNKLNHSGSKHGISKLSEAEVLDIKIALRGKEGKRKRPYFNDLAKLYNVDRKTIQSIARNKTWKHVA